MTKKEKYKTLDFLLSEFKTSRTGSELSTGSKIEFHIVHSLSTILLKKGYLTNYHEIASKSVRNDFVAEISQKGLFFLDLKGGFNEKYKHLKRKNNWIIAKIIANTLNAISILAIASIGIYISYESKKKDFIIKENVSKIDSLKMELKIIHFKIGGMKNYNRKIKTVANTLQN